MTLKRKFLLRNWGLVLGVFLVSAAALWCLFDLRPILNVVWQAYQDVGTIQHASNQINVARTTLANPNSVNIPFARNQFARAAEDLRTFIENEKKNYYMDSAQAALAHVTSAVASLDNKPPDVAAAVKGTDDVDRLITSAIFYCHTFIQGKDLLAVVKLRDGLILIGIIILLTLVGAGVIGYLQYRDVMVPLGRLREGVRRVASAQFSERIETDGSKEFAELAGEFNRMAVELDGFYRTLEEKVEAKSRELVRSERLASVGFLAAGVSHEINNPLNIISGYAELAAKRLTANYDASAINDAVHALRVIRDEAFRCKEITGKLLSLAKGDSGNRQPLALDSVAREVAVLAGGLKDYRDRVIELKLDEPLTVQANVTEMKQVLLNLTVNALEAVKPGEGKVVIEGHRRNGWIELSVCDNGYGIAADALKKVFEPFYTRRQGARAPGTGLGLSITHAIVESHGGRIRAESMGAGLGSRFTVELPAAGKETQ